MSEVTQQFQAQLRQDVVQEWGNKTDKILKACQAHMMDALSTELTIHQRFHCITCMQPEMLTDFFSWINEEGYCYVLVGFDYVEFMSHVVRWARGWAEERLLSPCTDGMPSSEVH